MLIHIGYRPTACEAVGIDMYNKQCLYSERAWSNGGQCWAKQFQTKYSKVYIMKARKTRRLHKRGMYALEKTKAGFLMEVTGGENKPVRVALQTKGTACTKAISSSLMSFAS